MKKIRIPFAVLLILLTAFAWTNQIGKLRSNEKNFTALCEKAQAYAENKLYQKAAEIGRASCRERVFRAV